MMNRERKIAFSILGAAVAVMLALALYGYLTGAWNGELSPP